MNDSTITVADLDFELLIEADSIALQIANIAKRINTDYSQRPLPLFIGVLNGAVFFMCDLLKAIDLPCEMAFIKVASYHGGLESSGAINLHLDLDIDIKDRHVILIEDIVDTGHTLRFLVDKLNAAKPASIAVCALLYKPQAMQHIIPELQYIGFEIENKFVVGYGLDYKQQGRNTKAIYQLVESITIP